MQFIEFAATIAIMVALFAGWYFAPDGRMLGRFRDWIARNPSKQPHEISAAHRFGRAAVGALVCGLLLYMLWRVFF